MIQMISHLLNEGDCFCTSGERTESYLECAEAGDETQCSEDTHGNCIWNKLAGYCEDEYYGDDHHNDDFF